MTTWRLFGAMRGAAPHRLSGLHAAENLNLPRPGVPVGYVPPLTGHLYTPRPDTTRFQDIFGLLPSEPKPDGPTVRTAVERIQARTEELVQRAEREGLVLFKQATVDTRDPYTERYEECPECPDLLARAVQHLKIVRDLDVETYLPSLLIAHAALEQDRPRVAMNELLRAFQREPKLFTGEAEPFDGYFGDAETEGGRSAYLEAQLLRYSRIDELNPESAEAMALKAYCAWRLGPEFVTQAREAAAQAVTLVLDDPEQTREVLGFSAALGRALR